MSLLAELEGMKFPDEMVTRFFFKSGLHRRIGRVLELGCGNGNNLGLFAAYGWHCTGLDYQQALIDQARRNFERQGYADARLEVADMNDPLPPFHDIDVLLMPGSLYYVHAQRGREIIRELGPRLNPGALVFCRFRTPEDYRFGRGDDLGQDSFRLTIAETSEEGCVNAFFSLESMLDVLKPCDIDTATLRSMRLVFDNLGRDDHMIPNHEMIVWGSTRTQSIDAS
jgi:SAM-dependent methyltransferase